jgi:hypothetical protein
VPLGPAMTTATRTDDSSLVLLSASGFHYLVSFLFQSQI